MKTTKKAAESAQNSAFKTTKIGCCQNCENRVIGCHGTCEKYLNERKALNEYNAKIHEELSLLWYFRDNEKERKKRARNARAYNKAKQNK